MKKLTKTLLSVAAVSALTAAMAASASAMTASYADGTVTLADITATGASQTMIILNEDAETITDTTIVKAIDQKDDGESFTTVPVGTLADGTYYVRIGGSTGTLQEATFTVGQTVVETETIVIGDCNGDKKLRSADVTMLARQQAKFTEEIGNVGVERTKADNSDTIVIGDCNGDKKLRSADVTMLARQQAKFTEEIGNVGTEVEVIKISE